MTKIVIAKDMGSWVKCQKCKKAFTGLANQVIAKCHNCNAVQRTNDCQRGHSVQLEIVTNSDPPSTLSVVCFEDCLDMMVNKYNNDNSPAVAITMDSDDDDIYIYGFAVVARNGN